MRMTLHTDYALRMLIYLATRLDRVCTVNEVAEACKLPRNHCLTVVQILRDLGFIDTTHGHAGGIQLARPPGEIGLGTLVRAIEETSSLGEFIHNQGRPCSTARTRHLKNLLCEALAAFLAVLDKYTLADIVRNRSILDPFLGIDTTVKLEKGAQKWRRDQR